MKIVGMLPVFNEDDIIEEVIQHLISQEIPLVVLDNGSNDNTYEICKKYIGKGILRLEQYASKVFQPDIMYRMLYDLALMESPDWVILSNSDEFLESGIQNTSLKHVIEKADSDECNLIQLNRFDFFMTDDDNVNAKSIKEKLKYYSYGGDFLYRAWKVFPGIRVVVEGGHYPIFPDEHKYKISPVKLILRHYPFRSKTLAEKKMKNIIRGRDDNDLNKIPLNPHERKIMSQDFASKLNHKLLTKLQEDEKWNYEIKYAPFTQTNPPRKEDIFSEDGFLKNKPKTPMEYRMELSRITKQYNELKLKYAFIHRVKNFFKK